LRFQPRQSVNVGFFVPFAVPSLNESDILEKCSIFLSDLTDEWKSEVDKQIYTSSLMQHKQVAHGLADSYVLISVLYIMIIIIIMEIVHNVHCKNT